LKAPEDAAVTASCNQRLQDSHSASDFERTAEQLVAEDPETATPPPSSGYDTSLDSQIRSRTFVGPLLFTCTCFEQ
jgi:hypothetical protein